jgi:hypothetical protein
VLLEVATEFVAMGEIIHSHHIPEIDVDLFSRNPAEKKPKHVRTQNVQDRDTNEKISIEIYHLVAIVLSKRRGIQFNG